MVLDRVIGAPVQQLRDVGPLVACVVGVGVGAEWPWGGGEISTLTLANALALPG